MDFTTRVERALEAVLASESRAGAPPGLTAAMRYSVVPGGARVRPRLCLAVAQACGDDTPAVTDAAAAAIEILHCASLVHDDLPCFDNADLRRGKPSVYKAFGERLALLAGDGLIVLAFEALARVAECAPGRLAPLLRIVSQSVGAASGIVGGQAWECEPRVVLADYQRAKTGALFAAATMAGAAAAGCDYPGWRLVGERLGEAYQIADDILDVIGSPTDLGKPVGVDSALGRPNAAAQLGVQGATLRLTELVHEAIEAIPACSDPVALKALIAGEARRLTPKSFDRRAA